MLDEGGQWPDPPVHPNEQVQETRHKETARVVHAQITVDSCQFLSVFDDWDTCIQDTVYILIQKILIMFLLTIGK